MKLLIINPNTTEAMTAKAEAAARAVLPEAVEIVAVTGRFGPRYIASRAAFAIAGHAALDAFAAHTSGADVVLLACFGDPGLDAIREVSPVPVIGLVEASARAAAREAGVDGRRFSIVTGGILWEPMLREALLTRGWSRNLASIRTVAPDGGTIARDPEGALQVLGEACDACIREDGAEAVILGGVGLIGLAERLQPGRAFPVICSVIAGLREVETLAASPTQKTSTAPVSAPVASIGLSPELSAVMARSS